MCSVQCAVCSAGWHKLRDRTTGGLRPSLSCEAEIWIIQNDLWNKRGWSQRNGPILAYFTRRVKLYSMITYIGDTVGLTQWNPALYNGWLHQIVSLKENTAHSVAKYRNTRFEAGIFRRTTVWGRTNNYVSLHRCLQQGVTGSIRQTAKTGFTSFKWPS